jgi:3-dehydroquinate dehydratase
MKLSRFVALVVGSAEAYASGDSVCPPGQGVSCAD